ncbi:hypothetical protein EV368DRAFT_52947 [Lentinula lateritia]|nr:hypothetical protein EV368DRAFT_52947 [Lentinula lateritia]
MTPTWCRLSSDVLLYDQPAPMRSVPDLLLLLQGAGSCACVDGGRAWYDLEKPKITKECAVYTLTRSYKTLIELQPCPLCPKSRRRYIGPETRNLGLFNYNNSSLFSHELLDEYTSAFSCSETPFDPWVIQVKRRYSLNDDGGIQFVSGGLFRDTWFAYARLMNLEGDKYCSICGKSPDNVIWDGVTLAYGRKHLETSLRPPITQDAAASERKEWLVETAEWRRLHCWIHRGGLAYEASPDKDREREEAGIIERRSDYPAIQEYLYSVDKSLGDLFTQNLGTETLSADESTLQTVNRESLQALHAFNLKPNQDTASRLIGIPILYHILRDDFDKLNGYSATVRGVCSWMYRRCYEVFTLVMRGVTSPVPLLEKTTTNKKDSWETTGCCYGMPQIRKRPKYPGIVNDGQVDVNKDRGRTCSKYYESYGKRKLTGGIMVCWCTHSICYGFHCIPESEGRNDVFSAMITHWEKAPKRVIYDFACSLGPYCMTREPEFFADTKFMVDGFHAYGHMRCSSASFVKSYMDVDSMMAGLNSSAAECGNNGIRRIRKSVSYMTQIHAIIYTWVFLSIWNRIKIKKMEKERLT